MRTYVISEMVFWLYAIRRNYSFEIDKQLHTKNEKNNSDVDIQIVKDGYTFNIEVKTPNQVKKTDESILNITIPFRSFERKDIQDEEVRKINRDISQAIINLSTGLEARPVAQLVQVASQFNSEIYVEIGKKRVNAKSIMGMMTLGLDAGEEITLSANGEDEEAAMAGIEQYLSNQ